MDHVLTDRMPSELRALLRLMLAAPHERVPSELRVRYASTTMHRLANCTWLGGGSDGFVLRQDDRVYKIRELVSDRCLRYIGREIAAGLLARVLHMPFVTPLLEWRVWVGEDSPLCARRVAYEIRTRVTSAPAVCDLIETLPSRDVRTRAYSHWCASHDPEFKAARRELARSLSAADFAVRVEGSYVDARAKYLTDELSRPHAFVVLTMPARGRRTLYAALTDPQLPWERRLVAPRQWSVLRAHICVLAHSLYALQTRYAFMHSDLNMSNLVLEPMNKLPRHYEQMWLPDDQWPNAAHVAAGPLVTMRDLDGEVLSLIDVSLASVDFQVAADALGVAPDGRTDPSVRALLARRQQYSRTTDLRRLGLYLAYALLSACAHCVQAPHPRPEGWAPEPRRWLAAMRERVDHRFALVATAMTTASAQWADLVRTRPDLADAVFEVPATLPVDRRTRTFASFVRHSRTLQTHLRRVLRLLDPDRRPGGDEAEAARLWLGHAAMTEMVELMVVDLNPHMDYAQRVYEPNERQDDPLLPENVLAWLPGRRR